MSMSVFMSLPHTTCYISPHFASLVQLLVQPIARLLAALGQMLQFSFMRSAFIAGTMIALVAGLIGYFVVLRHQIFASDTISHVAFAGAIGAALLGINPLIGLFVVSAASGLVLNALGARATARERDISTGMVMAWMLGLGALFLGIYMLSGTNHNTAIGVGILFGSIFGVDQQVVTIILVGIPTIVALLLMARPLLFASLDPEAALARGLPVRLLGALFMLLLGISVAEAVPAVGALLIFTLLILPAAIAQRLVKRPYAALLLSAVLAVLFVWVGLTLAFFTPYPASFLMTALAFIVYLAVLASRRLMLVIGQRRSQQVTISASTLAN